MRYYIVEVFWVISSISLVYASCCDEAACTLKLAGTSGQALCLFEELGNVCNASVCTCEDCSADNHHCFPQDKA